MIFSYLYYSILLGSHKPHNKVKIGVEKKLGPYCCQRLFYFFENYYHLTFSDPINLKNKLK